MTAPAQTRWPAPAKLNLFLHVTGRRADGYHELQTLFQLIDLCDTVAMSVRGVGERLTPLTLPVRWYVVIYPGVAVSTREVFQSPELTRNSPLITLHAFFESGGRNDCEPVVRSRAPQVAEALEWLARFAPARLTGTGSCVFSACGSAGDAERLAGRVPDRWVSFVARGHKAHP